MYTKEDWQKVEDFIENWGGKKPQDLKGYLFLIGLQVLGKTKKFYSKEEKQDLMHIALCEIFLSLGYYKFTHRDDDGWPHYDILDKIPHAKLFGQEDLIKQQIISYFYQEEFIR